MNFIYHLLIYLTILLILISLLYFLQPKKENFLHNNLNYNLNNKKIHNNYNNYQFINKTPYKIFLSNKDNKYLGFYKWWNNNNKLNSIKIYNDNDNNNNLYNKYNHYIQKDLLYDGVWKVN